MLTILIPTVERHGEYADLTVLCTSLREYARGVPVRVAYKGTFAPRVPCQADQQPAEAKHFGDACRALFYEPQRADQLIVSIEKSLHDGLDFRIELYQKDYERPRPHFENLFDPLQLMPELGSDRVEVAPDGGQARGVEAMLARRGDGPWSWWLSYAWSRVTDRIDGDDVARSWDQRHSVGAGLRFTRGDWEVTVTDSYHTGWPTKGLYLVPDPAGGADVVTVGARNAERFSDYNSFDFRVMRRFDLPESMLEASFELSNALAQRNPCCTEYTVTAPAGATWLDERCGALPMDQARSLSGSTFGYTPDPLWR